MYKFGIETWTDIGVETIKYDEKMDKSNTIWKQYRAVKYSLYYTVLFLEYKKQRCEILIIVIILIIISLAEYF